MLGGRSLPTPGAQETFFEGAIDPASYVVGPGDRFRLIFWRPTYTETVVEVTGEGELVIPLVGLVPVAGQTLQNAKTSVNAAVAKALRVGEVTLSLVEPRKFRVHVTGAVNFPGPYTLTATSRVSDAILMAGGLIRDRVFEKGDTASVVAAAQRRIELRLPGGDTSGIADLLSYERCGDLKSNPYLRDGQTVHVPALDKSADRIAVSGAVLAEGQFEYVAGDDLQKAVALAGGFSHHANRSGVLVVSRSGRSISVDLSQPGAATVSLSPGDRVLVTASPDTNRAGSVTIVGEVAAPGGYAIIDGVTTLREVLQRCGGLLPTAVVHSVRLVRSSESDPIAVEKDRILSNWARLNSRSSYYADQELAAEFARWQYGTVVLDVEDADLVESEAGNTPLRDGDRIEIPSFPLGVRVLGAVNEAGEVPWIEDGNLNDYLEAAGGINRDGWRRKAVVIRAKNGSQLRYSSRLGIDPGDVVFVPTRPVEQTAWETFKDFVAVTAQVATVILVIDQAGK